MRWWRREAITGPRLAYELDDSAMVESLGGKGVLLTTYKWLRNNDFVADG